MIKRKVPRDDLYIANCHSTTAVCFKFIRSLDISFAKCRFLCYMKLNGMGFIDCSQMDKHSKP